MPSEVRRAPAPARPVSPAQARSRPTFGDRARAMAEDPPHFVVVARLFTDLTNALRDHGSSDPRHSEALAASTAVLGNLQAVDVPPEKREFFSRVAGNLRVAVADAAARTEARIAAALASRPAAAAFIPPGGGPVPSAPRARSSVSGRAPQGERRAPAAAAAFAEGGTVSADAPQMASATRRTRAAATVVAEAPASRAAVPARSGVLGNLRARAAVARTDATVAVAALPGRLASVQLAGLDRNRAAAGERLDAIADRLANPRSRPSQNFSDVDLEAELNRL